MAPVRRPRINTRIRKVKTMVGKSYNDNVRPTAVAPPKAKNQLKEEKIKMARRAMRMNPEDRAFEDEKEYARLLTTQTTNDLRIRNKEIGVTKELASLVVPKKQTEVKRKRGRPLKRKYGGVVKKGNRRIVNERTDPEYFEKTFNELPSLPFIEDDRDMKEFKKKTKVEKKTIYQTKFIRMKQFSDVEVFRKMEIEMFRKIASDTVLKEFYKVVRRSQIDKTIMWKMGRRLFNIFHDTRAERYKEETGKEITAKEKWKGAQGLFREEFAEFARNVAYVAPANRIRLASNLTFNKKEILPVFSDIPGETRPTVSNAFFYKYADRNHVHPDLSPDLTDFTKLAEKPENVIKCNCHSKEKAVPCWRNEKCPCYQMNLQLQSLQAIDVDHRDFRSGPTNFSTFDPVLINHKDHFFNTVGFACSDLCRCKGCCTNNITMLAEKKVFAFEKFRKDANMGFSLRTLNAIPAGTPCLEFTGSMDTDDLDAADQDYAYKVIEEGEKFIEQAQHFENKWTDGYKEKLVHLYKTDWFLNPKRYGNMSRTLCHSCEPNITMVRIFQKSFSPAHVRLLLVALEDIFPGTELTFDYGPKYEGSIGSSSSWCRCQKIGCQSSSSFEDLSTSSEPTVQAYYALRHANEYRRFDNCVLKPLATSQEYNKLKESLIVKSL